MRNNYFTQITLITSVIFTLFSNCTHDYTSVDEIHYGSSFQITADGPLVRTSLADEILRNMQFYAFAQGDNALSGGGGSWQSRFNHHVVDFTRNGLTMRTPQMRAGNWDLAMVSPNGASLVEPVVSREASKSLMYSFTPSNQGDNAHEIWSRTRRIPTIVAGQSATDNCAISRNVSMVRVVIERAVNVSTSSDAHVVRLHNVPSKISWAGTLLRTVGSSYETSISNPDTLSAPLVRKLTFTPSGSEVGAFKSDTVIFIIPAHRERDFWVDATSQNATRLDTLTHKMYLSFSFDQATGGKYMKGYRIPIVTRCNENLLLKVRVKDVAIEIVPLVSDWNTQAISVANNAPYLNVANQQTTLYDGAASRIYFWSNQPADSVFVTRVGQLGGAALTDVDTQLDRLVGATAANRYYDAATKSGYIDIVNQNVTANQPDLKIYLKAGSLQREITVKRTASAQTLKNLATSYVGTFHRWNETGERLVTWNYTGAWTAYVDDPSGTGTDVLIDRLSSPAFQDGSLYGNSPLNPEPCKVMEGARSVTGMNKIYFRVGWRNNAPTSTQPRYATITVRQGINNPSGTIIRVLYLRQGEAADYLMRPSDAVSSATRPDAVKFTPYNLTNPNMGSGGSNLSNHNKLNLQTLSVGENRFTTYPTQAGAFFQWSTNTLNERRAYHPTNPAGAISDWPTSFPATYWSTLGVVNETCPSGYRRPNDGVTDLNTEGLVSGSELRQSLYLAPQASIGSNTSNKVWGYYADGFFDRRAINSSAIDVVNSAVSNNTKDAAYVGSLFFNPATKASIFFPASGYRRGEPDGALTAAGSGGRYWSSSSQGTVNGWSLFLDNSTVRQSYGGRNNGFSIRCVLAELSITPQTVTLSSTTGNTSRTITINSSTPWTITGLPANASVSPTSGGAGTTTVTLTRNNNAYGKYTMTVKNATGRTEHVVIESLYITPDELWLNNNVPGVNTKDFDIIVWGGSEDWIIVPGSYPNWLTPEKLPNGKLRLSAQQYTISDEREGTVTIAHADDPAYTTTFKIVQMVYSDIPPFQYFVTKVTWGSGSDVDIAVEFAGNYLVNAAGNPTTTRAPFDNKGMGWRLRSGLNLDGSIAAGSTAAQLQAGLAFWGGDATQGQGETVFFNAPLITPDPGDYRNNPHALPRKINMNVYVTWYSSHTGQPVTVSFYTYEGGVMVKGTGTTANVANDKNFYNVNNTSIVPSLSPDNTRPHTFHETRTKTINTRQGVGDYRNGYTLFCTVTYDRWTRAATINWDPAAAFSKRRAINIDQTDLKNKETYIAPEKKE